MMTCGEHTNATHRAMVKTRTRVQDVLGNGDIHYPKHLPNKCESSVAEATRSTINDQTVEPSKTPT